MTTRAMHPATRQAWPSDPVAAVTHPDPYPYYAHLVARRPFAREAALGLWIAASAAAVTAVLASDLCAVRPPAEPVPTALLGSPAAEIFRRLVRMTGGPRQRALKRAVAAALGALAPQAVSAASRRWARELPSGKEGRIADFLFQLPVYTVASLLGVPRELLEPVASWTSDFVAALAPSATAEQLARGWSAAEHLQASFRALLSGHQQSAETLLARLAQEAQIAGREEADAVVANAIGFLFQAHDATAGLLGNTLVALARHPDIRRRAAAAPDLLAPLIQEVLRCDPPVQNTRRFLVHDGVIAGRTLRAGDAVLVLLAAANRDPAANPHPDRFDLDRRDRRIFTFGSGGHACPGDALATAIARAGIEQLLQAGVDLTALSADVAYRPSVNTRMPLFNAAFSPVRR